MILINLQRNWGVKSAFTNLSNDASDMLSFVDKEVIENVTSTIYETSNNTQEISTNT